MRKAFNWFTGLRCTKWWHYFLSILIGLGMMLIFTNILYAGDKEDYQSKLDKLVQAKNISGLGLENLQLKAQLAKTQDDKNMADLNDLVKEMQGKGFLIQQKPDGTIEVVMKPPEPKKEELKK